MFDAKHRKRTTPEEAAHKAAFHKNLDEHKLRQRRHAEGAKRDKEQEEHNARNLERLKLEVRAREAKKARVNRLVDDYERSERGPLTADDIALVKDFKETL